MEWFKSTQSFVRVFTNAVRVFTNSAKEIRNQATNLRKLMREGVIELSPIEATYLEFFGGEIHPMFVHHVDYPGSDGLKALIEQLALMNHLCRIYARGQSPQGSYEHPLFRPDDKEFNPLDLLIEDGVWPCVELELLLLKDEEILGTFQNYFLKIRSRENSLWKAGWRDLGSQLTDEELISLSGFFISWAEDGVTLTRLQITDRLKQQHLS